ncbi:MAG: lipoyl(octanoyl) transferase LipB [Cyclobacteriaceae bacterium]|nr:lipoyl(octanoyl) transferase LipB [Cyclobacteriaceae bacterium]
MNTRRTAETQVIDLGLIDYTAAWNYQTELFNGNLAIKKANRDRPEDDQLLTKNYLLFCEHPPVITLGKSGDESNLLANEQQLKELGASFVATNRGGDITFHGPGQWVVYPIFDLENFFTDISRYMRSLEEAVIRTLEPYGIRGSRIEGLTGVWITEGNPRKICALGVKSSRWVTMHGLALNVNVDLHFFDYIVPCGIKDKEVTSMMKEKGHEFSMTEIKQQLKANIASIFQLKLIE